MTARSVVTVGASLSDCGSLPGFASTTVGLIGAGRIALSLARRLQPFGFRVLAHDPYANRAAAQEAGIELVELGRVPCRVGGDLLARPGHR